MAGFEGLYNFYNIGATSSAEPMGAIKNGLRYARDGHGASQETRNKYLIPWINKEKAITGGGIFIGSSYISVGQNTVYFQKFHVTDTKGGNLFWHQYMTNVLAPYSESKSIYQGYKNNGLIDSPMHFIIPVYNNMPEIPVDNPNIIKSDFKNDNTKVYCNANKVNIRTGPSTSYEILTQLNETDKMTRIAKGIQNGDRWDKIRLENGMIGYIYQTYVTEKPPIVEVTGIELDTQEIYLSIGEKITLNAKIEPENANNPNILYEVENPNIVSIDTAGNVTALTEGKSKIKAISQENNSIQKECTIIVTRKLMIDEILFQKPLVKQGIYITGIPDKLNTVKDIKKYIKTNLEIESLNYRNEILSENDKVGTNCKIQIKENGNILKKYNIILYGDVNGDGKINSVDVLVLQRHILEIQKLEPIYQRAGNINKNGKKPSSVDLLLIQRHILEIKQIEQ